jgi:hypothetical protein
MMYSHTEVEIWSETGLSVLLRLIRLLMGITHAQVYRMLGLA